MERSELPTDERLSELRQQGLTPLSLLSIRILAAMLLFFCLYIVIPGVIAEISGALADYSHQQKSMAETATGLFEPLFRLIIFPALILTFGSILWGLVQTKFLFLPSKLAVNVSNLWSSFGARLPLPIAFLKEIFTSTLLLLCAVLAALVLTALIARELLVLLNIEQPYVALYLKKLSNSLFPLFMTFGFLLVIISWLIRRYRFMLNHRMSRAEIEQEAKAR